VVSTIFLIRQKAGVSLTTDKREAFYAQSAAEIHFYSEGQNFSEHLKTALSASLDPVGESSEDHRDRLFLQVLLSLTINIIALIGIFYFLLPLSEGGRAAGGSLLWTVLGITVGITAIFLKFGRRVLCVNLLLFILSGLLVGASFILGGVLSPTMIFLLAIPVLAATLLNSRWAFLWTSLTVAAWLLILVLENNGMEMTRVTIDTNIGIVQVISLLGTVLVVMAVLGSYVAANSRLRTVLEQKNGHLEYLARHDPLTSIANRRAFFEHAQHCLQRAARSKKPFAFLLIDLNDFKQINDRLGHKVGDAVLKHFAQRMKLGFRETDFIGRLGGDEFGVILEPVDGADSVAVAMQRFHSGGPNSVEVDSHPVRYEFAIGSSTYPENGDTVVDLCEAADAAMYRSKRGVPPAFRWK
jgi:diguanylate cyclase (GGDEF)-like protein